MAGKKHSKAKAVKKRQATPKHKNKPKAAPKPEEPKEEKPRPRRVIEPPVKLVGHPSSMIIFGVHVTEPKIRSAAIEAYRKRMYTTDDINAGEFFNDKSHDNLMVKIAILDRIQEMTKLLYPHTNVERKNKITLLVD